MILDVTIPGEPVGKARARVVTRRKGGKPLPFARSFTPEKTGAWEDKAVDAFRAVYKGGPIDEPLVLVVEAIAGRGKALLPKSTTNKGGLSPRAVAADPGLLRRLWRTTKPDGDNVLKCVGDALVNAGVIRDDTRIVRWECLSLVAAVNEGPSVTVRLERASARPS